MTDQFTTYDAAYLLGALTPPDRAAFEAHLEQCDDCRSSVHQLAGMPGLLAAVPPESLMIELDDPPPLPDTLLPRLLAEVQRARFRRRWTVGLVGAAAAAVVAIALAFGLGDAPSSVTKQPPATHAAAAQVMKAVSPRAQVHAKVVLTDKAWGTAMRIWCVYDKPPVGGWGDDTSLTYTMVVTDKSGATQQVAAWSVKPGQPVVATASTSVPRSQIASVQVRDPSDVPVLELKL